MKIKTIRIKNFLALEKVTLNLQAPINIIAGTNEVGKSSIRDAIQWCLTGQARGLKTHQDQSHLIREGAKAAEVAITLTNGQAITREKKPKTPSIVSGPVPDDQVMASILCDPLTFLSLPDYDALAKALALEGIPSQLIAEALESINNRLYLASSYLFPEYDDCPIVLTQNMKVYRKSPYACLSKSAKYRAGICFQYVLATLVNARLMMIDDVDILDPANRAQLIDFLLAVRQDFDSILLFVTSNEAHPSLMPEIQVWWIDEGKITPLIAEVEEHAAG